MIRELLKRTFPATKFSVRMKSFSMGSSISIGWKDGPTVSRVTKLIGAFEGKGFDGMTDSTTYRHSWLSKDGTVSWEPSPGAEEVSFYAWIHYNRDVSIELATKAAELVGRYFGQAPPAVKAYQWGGWSVDESQGRNPEGFEGDYWSWQNQIRKALENRQEFLREEDPGFESAQLEPAGSAAGCSEICTPANCSERHLQLVS